MRALYDSKTETMDDFGIRKYFTKQAKLESWLQVEAALALSQGEAGIIPREAAEQIKAAARYENLDLAEMDRIYKEVGHGFVPFLKVLVKACPGDSGKYVHYGVTTQNIQQTAQLLLARKIYARYMLAAKKILTNLAKLAADHKDTVMAGRTHGRHAEPITYGYKASVWISELIQALERLQDSEKRVFQCMMGGAVGVFSAMPEKGEEVQKLVAQKLQMPAMPVPSRNISTHKIEFIADLALLANVCHKMAEEVYQTSIEEMGEVSEGFKAGTIGSSTMPHKINPKLAKGIIANSQKLYSLVSTGLYSSARPFEGDSSNYMLFDGLMDEALQLMTEVILRAEELTATLTIHKDRMLENAKINGGLDNSEYIMMQIANKLGKDKAHSVVYELAMEKIHSGRPYFEILESSPIIKEHFTAEEVQAMLDPANYTGIAGDLALRLSEDALAFAKTLEKYEAMV